MNKTSQSAGGKAKSAKIRAAYIPKLCKQCNLPIQPRDDRLLADAKKKQFCNRSCAARYRNLHKDKKQRICKGCSSLFNNLRNRYCDKCHDQIYKQLGLKTKGEVSRRSIASHSVTKMNNRDKICQKCGYNKFVEICHIKGVSSFSSITILDEINDPANLIYLCPNCHYEMDHNL